MRLLILPSQYPQGPADPAGIFIRDQAQTLARRHEVTVLVPQLLTPRRLLAESRRADSSQPPHVPLPAGPGSLREIPTPIFNLTNRWTELTHHLWRRQITAQAGRLIAENRIARPDLVHAHVVRPAGGAAVSLARLWQTKSVLTEHSGPFAVHLQTRPGRRETQAVLHAVDGLIAVSPFLAKEIQTHFHNVRPSVVGNVVDEDYFTPGPPAHPRGAGQPFRFLFIGGLTWHKGASTLLEAAATLRQQGNLGWQLVIVGGGPDEPALRRQAAASGLGAQVHFAGCLPREAVRAWIRSSDVLVQPSVIETFCVVLLEAMACGVPVIATDCGGPTWIVRPEGGQLVAPGDAAALARAMAEAQRGRLPGNRDEIRRSIIGRFGRTAWLADIERVYAAIQAG